MISNTLFSIPTVSICWAQDLRMMFRCFCNINCKAYTVQGFYWSADSYSVEYMKIKLSSQTYGLLPIESTITPLREGAEVAMTNAQDSSWADDQFLFLVLTIHSNPSYISVSVSILSFRLVWTTIEELIWGSRKVAHSLHNRPDLIESFPIEFNLWRARA